MAYDINSYISSIQNKKKSSYSPFGGNTRGNLFGRINTGVSSFMNRGTAAPQTSTYKPQSPVQPQSTSAVGSKSGVTITPPKTTSSLPPAGQTYVNNLSSPAPKIGAQPAPESPSSLPAQTEDAYISYLKTLFNPESSKLALAEKESAMKRLADIQSQTEAKDLAARREYEAKLDEAGGLREGAQASASASARRSNQELADLAVQESAAARSAQVASDTYAEYINAGKTVFEAETAAKEAAEKAKQQVFENDLAMKKFEEDKRQFGLQYALDAQKASQAISGGALGMFGGADLTTGQRNDIADMLVVQKQITGLNDLASKYGGFVGAGVGSGIISQPLAKITGKIRPGAQDIRNNIGQIKGFIAKLRGGTSFTANEQKLLDTYTPSIGDSDAVIKSKLNSLNQYINDKLESIAIASGGYYNPTSQSGGVLRSPDGKMEVSLSDLTPAEIKEAQEAGWQ